MEIDAQAPAASTHEAAINASAQVVWDTLTDFESWPSWMPGVRAVFVDGPVAEGTAFAWKASGLRIRSVLEEVDAPREIGWTGRTLGIRARHVWRVEATDSGARALSAESWDGRLPRLLPKQARKALDRAVSDGVEALRSEAQRRAAG